MYFIGSNVINWPYQAQRALADGHEVRTLLRMSIGKIITAGIEVR